MLNTFVFCTPIILAAFFFIINPATFYVVFYIGSVILTRPRIKYRQGFAIYFFIFYIETPF